MDLLPLYFRTFQFFGFWYDKPRSNRLVKLLYRSLVMLLIVHLSLFQMIALFSERRSMEEYVNTLFLVLTYVVHICKSLVFMARRRSVARLLDMFRGDVCLARDAEEENILGKYLGTADWIYKARMNLTMGCGFMAIVPPLLIGCFTDKKVELPWATYFFDVADPLQFVLVYVLQALAICAAIITDVCLDSTPCAFMILTCGQLELCCHRMRRDNNAVKVIELGDETAGREESNFFKQYARHHVAIQKIVRQVQTAFIPMILPIFSSALLTLCSSVFHLAQKNLSPREYLFIIIYLSCLLLQIYLFCWFGNELQLKGQQVTDEIYKTDWIRINPKARNNYWYIMFMGRNKFVISFHGQCALNLQTFIWMIKTSYGAFNLLSQVSSAQ